MNRYIADNAVRLGSAALAVAVLGWLCLESAGGRRDRINQAVRAGVLGDTAIAQSDRFKRFCEAIVRGGGVETSLQVNGSLVPGKVNIISTVESAKHLTGCGRGNAVYDASVDCVFVDQELIASGLHDTTKEWGPRTTYLAFVILHEIGHRQLHRRTGAMFDSVGVSDPAARRRELEADEFAERALKLFYDHDLKEGGAWVGTSHRDTSFFLYTGMNDRDRMVNDLVTMAWELPDEMMRSSSEYSPLYRDAAHPMMVSRLSRALSAVDGNSISDYEVRVLLNLVREQLSRISANGQARVCEVACPDEIGGVFAGDRDLLIATREGGIFRLEKSRARNAISSTGYGAMSLSAQDMKPGPGGIHEVFAVWRTPQADVALADSQGTLCERQGDKWTKRSLGARVDPEISLYRNRLFRDETQPINRTVCLLGGDVIEGFTYYGISDDAITHREGKQVEQEVCGLTGLSKVEIKTAGVIGDQLFCAVFDRGKPDALFSPLHGIARFTLPGLELQEVQSLGPGSSSMWLETVIAAPNGGAAPRFFGTGLGEDTEKLGWSLWEFFPKYPAKLLDDMSRQQTALAVNCRLYERTNSNKRR